MPVRSRQSIALSRAALLAAAHSVEQLQLSNRLDRLRDCAGIAGRDQRVNGRLFCE